MARRYFALLCAHGSAMGSAWVGDRMRAIPDARKRMHAVRRGTLTGLPYIFVSSTSRSTSTNTVVVVMHRSSVSAESADAVVAADRPRSKSSEKPCFVMTRSLSRRQRGGCLHVVCRERIVVTVNNHVKIQAVIMGS